MKKLPLTAKVALWSFVLAGITMGSALFVMTKMLERELVSVVDQRLERTAKDVFWELDHRPEGPAEKLTTITKEMMPRSLGILPIEILGPGEKVLYHSQGLKQFMLRGGPAEPHRTMIGKASYQVVTDQHRGLTVLIGYPLRGTELSLGRGKTASLVALPVAAVLSLLCGYSIAGAALKP